MSNEENKKTIWDRTTIANFVSGALVIMGMVFAIATLNVDLVVFLTGAGVGYLFKTLSK